VKLSRNNFIRRCACHDDGMVLAFLVVWTHSSNDANCLSHWGKSQRCR